MKDAAQPMVNHRILVIDDLQDIHEDFRKILAGPSLRDPVMEALESELFGAPAAPGARAEQQQAVFQLDDAYQGQDGLRLVEQARAAGRPYALAFVDMRMPPGWDGLETITHLWTADPDLQIVICTAFSDYSWQEIFARVGASDRLLIIKKPFDTAEIVQLAHTLTEKWALARQVGHQVDGLEGAVLARTRDLSATNMQLVDSVAELRRSSEALRFSEERFRSIVDATHAAIALIDVYGRIERWNMAAERLFGWSAGEVQGQPLAQVLPGLLGDELRTRLEGLLNAEDGTQAGIVLDGQHRDGRLFQVELSLSAWSSERGRGFTCLMQELGQHPQATTGILAAKEAAESASRAKSAFLASMSHEIRTPMTGIIGMADLLLGSALDVQQRDFAGTVKSCANHLLGLINDILDCSRIEAGQLTLECIDFDLRTVIEDVVALFRHQAQLRRIELVMMVDAAVPVMVAGDPARLRQVLVNLLGNAVKFTAQGEVMLRVLAQGAQDDRVRLRFEVSDTGIGIPPEAQSRIFQSFSQAETSTSRRFGGTGLGLAISKRLVELMGGVIGLDSQPGQGSTFHVELDLAVRPHAPASLDADLIGLRVLYVDDHAGARLAVQQQLAGWKMCCDTAPSGQRALAMLRAASASGQPYGLLILDLHMPDMDGFALARAVKAEAELAAVGMLMLCDAAQRGQGAAARAAGILAFLCKPVRGTLLLAAIRMVVESRRGEPPGELVTQHTLKEQERLTRPRVLVADDEYTCRKLTCLLLEQRGFRVDTVGDGHRALEAVLTNGYALALLDAQMPGLDGLALARAIRQQEPPGRRTPLLALTAHASEELRERCLDAGMDDLLAKPFTDAVLDGLLQRWLPAFAGGPLADQTATDQAAPISEELLATAARQGGGETAVLKAFLVVLVQGVMDVLAAIAKADPVSLEHAAAQLRDACDEIGAVPVGIQAEELERLGHGHDLHQAVQHITPLRQAWAATEAWARHRLDQRPSAP